MAYKIVYCPACGTAIELHEHMASGYCLACGDKVLLDDAQNNRFSRDLLENADGDTLYAAATQGGAMNPVLMKAAAVKKHIAACVEYGHYLIGNDEAAKAKPYVKIASDAGNADGMFLYASTQVSTGYATTESQLKSLLKLVQKAHTSGKCSYDCTEVLSVLKDMLEELQKPKYTPSSYSLSSSSSYPPPTRETTIWTDWRTGEPLYRENGKIVNGSGEEVSVAWWD